MINLALILLIILGVLAIIDWKFKAIPSTFLTGIMFATAMIHFHNFEVGLISLSFGILALMYAWTLYEANFIGGIADVKVLIIIGLMISSVQMFFIFMLLVLLFGIAYKLIFRYVLKKDDLEEVPFIPCIYSIYIALFLIRGLV